MKSLRLALLAVGLMGLAACGEGGGGGKKGYGVSNCNSQNVRYEPYLRQFVHVPGGQIARCNIPQVSCTQLGLRSDGYNAGWGSEVRWFDQNGRYVPHPNCREAVEGLLYSMSGGQFDPQTYAQNHFDPICNDPRYRNSAQYNQRCQNLWTNQANRHGQFGQHGTPRWAHDPIHGGGGGAYVPYGGHAGGRQPRLSCAGVFPFQACVYVY